MTDPASQPTEEELRDFLARLDEFHDSLPESQKPMLEQLTHAALSPADAEVEGFATLAEYPLLLGLIGIIASGAPAPHQQQTQQQNWMTRGVTGPTSNRFGGV